MAIYFGCRPWARAGTEDQRPGACERCGGALRADGKTYCAACHAIPGGEHLAAADDRAEAEEGEAVTVGDVEPERVKFSTGIDLPRKWARKCGVRG